MLLCDFILTNEYFSVMLGWAENMILENNKGSFSYPGDFLFMELNINNLEL